MLLLVLLAPLPTVDAAVSAATCALAATAFALHGLTLGSLGSLPPCLPPTDEDSKTRTRVRSHWRISRHYCRTWFWLDLVSVMPVDTIMMGVDTQASTAVPRHPPRLISASLPSPPVVSSVPTASLLSSLLSPSSLTAFSPISLHSSLTRSSCILPSPLSSQGTDLGVLKMIRMLRLLRLVKLAKILKASAIFARWEFLLPASYSSREVREGRLLTHALLTLA